jgi:hypothetical protein
MYCGSGGDAWVTTDFALRMFAAERARAITSYRKFIACDAHSLASPFELIRGEQTQVLGSDEFMARLQDRLGLPLVSRMSLDALFAECCKRFNITEALLRSKMRHDRIVEARAWIAKRARAERIASLAELGRKLGCEPKTLRLAMAKYGGEKVEPG